MYTPFHNQTKLLAIGLCLAVLVPSTSFAKGNSEGGLDGFEVGPQESLADLPRVIQTLVAPPFLPEHTQIAVGGPKVVQIEMEIIEKEIQIN